jgi:hypothetical protein
MWYCDSVNGHRMIRRVFTFTAGLSLLLCVVAVWLQSGDRRWLPSRDGRIEWEAVQFARAGRFWEAKAWYAEPAMFRLTSVAGFPGSEPIRLVRVTVDTVGYETESQPFFSFLQYIMARVEWHGCVFEHGRRRIELNPDGTAERTVYHRGYSDIRETGDMPYWTISIPARTSAVALGILPAAWLLIAISRRLLRFVRTRHRQAECRCVWCGYDLRASKDRCPECGREMKSTSAVESRYNAAR